MDLDEPLPELSAEQRSIVEAPLDARLLVLAGAGSGKTHVLVARLAELLRDPEVRPGNEILVLSFTRAVVQELKRRLASATDRARLVRPMTFDSFSTRLLANTPGLEDWTGWPSAGYDGRVAAASTAIAEKEAAQERLNEFRHIFVDEVQDLVSVRARLVLEVLKATSGGFTLLGDPAQGIYDWQLRGSDDMSSNDMLREVRQTFFGALEERHLNHNYRARSEVARRVAGVGALLRAAEPDYEGAEQQLWEVLEESPSVERLSGLPVLLGSIQGSTAVLCRTNVQALRISRELYQKQVDHRLQRQATERPVASWVAHLFRDLKFPDIGRSKFERRLNDIRAQKPGVPPDEVAWDWLVGEAGDEGDKLNVRRLAERVRGGRVSDDLLDASPAMLTVSTTHRAKGLEYDDVLVVEPELDPSVENFEEEVRIVYVALSRARDELWKVARPKRAPWGKPDNLDDRWVKSSWDSRWKTLGLEIKPDDIDPTHPPGHWLVAGDPRELQEYLTAEVHRGDTVVLERCHVRQGADPVAFYRAIHEDVTIGVTSEAFGEMLARRLRPKSSDAWWPETISDVFIDSIDTVSGVPGLGEEAGLGASDLWLRPRLVGLGRVNWY